MAKESPQELNVRERVLDARLDQAIDISLRRRAWFACHTEFLVRSG